jgi:hypothetical protein
LYRSVGPRELELIRQSGFREFPARLPEQPIFYPVLNEEYAIQIARDWNTRDAGSGYVLKFEIQSEFLSTYDVHVVGSSIHREYWIPSGDLEEFNRNIVGTIQMVHEFKKI